MMFFVASMGTILKKVFLYFFVFLLLILLLLGASVYFFKEKWLEVLVREANSYLAVPVKTHQIEITWLETFPNIALRLDSIAIEAPDKNPEHRLGNGSYLYLGFDFWKLWNGNYTLKEIRLSNAWVNVYIPEVGKPSFEIFKPDSADEKKERKVLFDIERISLENVTLQYIDEKSHTIIKGEVHKGKAALHEADAKNQISFSGNGRLELIQANDKKWLAEKDFNLETQLSVDSKLKTVSVQPTQIQINTSDFALQGNVGYGTNKSMNLKVKASQSSIATLTDLLPISLPKSFSTYKTKGNVYFEAGVENESNFVFNPQVNAKFGCKDISLTEPKTGFSITNASFSGSFSNGGKRNLESCELKLNDLVFSLNQKPAKGNLYLKNFADPWLEFDFKGHFDLKQLHELSAVKSLERVNGSLMADIVFKGKLNDLKSTKTASRIQTLGNLTLENATWKFKNRDFVCKEVKGGFSFTHSDIRIDFFKGTFGQSVLELKGLFKNAFSFFLIDDHNFVLEAELKANHLHLDELLKTKKAIDELNEAGESNKLSETKEPYRLKVNKQWKVMLDCDIQSLAFEKFRPRNLQGILTIEDSKLYLENLRMKVAGGSIKMRGKVLLQNPEKYQTAAHLEYSGLELDSVFYITNDFGQQFLTSTHLDGWLMGETSFELDFNDRLEINPASVKADIEMKVENGALKQFKPIMQLSKFLKRADLENLKFDVLKNTFHVEDELVIMPGMLVKSNAFEATVAGNHNFKQLMDYRITIPLKNFRKPDKDEQFGELKKEEAEDGNLHLLLKGYPDNFKISYDKEKLKTKILQKLKEEKNELLDIFRNLKKKEKTIKKPEPEKKEEPEFIEF